MRDEKTGKIFLRKGKYFFSETNHTPDNEDLSRCQCC